MSHSHNAITHVLVYGIALVICACVTPAAADSFPAVFSLSSLQSRDGFRINGAAANDLAGSSVSAGDFNNDGLMDLMISAPFADGQAANSGSAYVLFGRNAGWPETINLANFNSTVGVRFNGVSENSNLASASNIGDLNNDGIVDLGLSSAGPNLQPKTYVVFGSNTLTDTDLATLSGSNGLRMDGHSPSALRLDASGDVNDDGIDDLIIGDPLSTLGGNNTGSSYVVFGRNTAFAATLSLTGLNGTQGFRVDGIPDMPSSHDIGYSVSGAGDINQDGTADLIIGESGQNSIGRSYVIFGRSSFASPIAVSSLNGSNGFRLDGRQISDNAGASVSEIGDINNDGIDDLVVGASQALSEGNGYRGRAYVVFGRTSGFAAAADLESVNGTNGFVLNGVAINDSTGAVVERAGDINHDGIDDLLVGAPFASPNNLTLSGMVAVVFGRSGGFPPIVELSSLNGSNGFRMIGEALQDNLGASLSAAGDLNGDGIDDLIVGASRASPNGINNAGRAYVIFGRDARAFSNGFED